VVHRCYRDRERNQFLDDLPLRGAPGYSAACLLIFLFQWESFLWPLIATRSENLKVIQVALAGFEER
jgi:ABC-type glycerol-3-phosphate transport system permease component